MRQFKLLALLMGLIFLLSGCIAALAIGTAGLIAYDKRSLSMIERDTRLFYLIHKEIVKEPRFNSSRVVVTSFNEVILLLGETATLSLKQEAEKIAHSTPNVKRIYNEIKVGEVISYAQRTNDTWITSQIRPLMLAEKGLESGSIRIITENGVVYLMGIVTYEQATKAANVARQVNGVRKVVKIFQYIV